MLGERVQNHNKTKMSLVTSEKGFYEFKKSGSWGYKPLIAERWSAAFILEIFWGERDHRKECQCCSFCIRDYESSAKLYEYLRELGNSVLFCDTDSVIYVQNVSEPKRVKTGDYLGDLTDEVEGSGAGSYIEEFI